MTKATKPSRALIALRRGEISFRSYLADRIQHALGPLADRLTTSQLRRVGQVLRVRLKLDPILVRYVERLRHGGPSSDPPPSAPGGVG